MRLTLILSGVEIRGYQRFCGLGLVVAQVTATATTELIWGLGCVPVRVVHVRVRFPLSFFLYSG